MITPFPPFHFTLQILGKGAFGKVYLAFAQGLLGGDEDITVAVKQLKGNVFMYY